MTFMQKIGKHEVKNVKIKQDKIIMRNKMRRKVK